MRRRRQGHTLQTTALINEAHLRLVDSPPVAWECRSHFFAVAASTMRRILVDHARSRRSLKRGSQGRPIPLDEELLPASGPSRDLVTLDDALTELTALDARKGRVVELRFFGGLSVEETAAVLRVSPQTVMRDWKPAKVWLLRDEPSDGARVSGIGFAFTPRATPPASTRSRCSGGSSASPPPWSCYPSAQVPMAEPVERGSSERRSPWVVLAMLAMVGVPAGLTLRAVDEPGTLGSSRRTRRRSATRSAC